ncbi:1cd3fd05-b2d5-48a6-a435-eb4b6ae0545c [Thermothielavioides terrestris]|uniref:endo-1,3(4)-beta-glucanase n=1 Tax=Thermothielavioides terrestris TaxID=2587410 RepID=A0A446B8M2_9PEZI|nr:1cd3fd05-b2d5-48a6-a435-eb4b6ae0545c [Thermothielavioides terrestris]
MVRLRASFRFAGLAFAACSVRAASQYGLVDVYDASNFFTEFDFFTQPDPTNGFVKYVDAATANRDGLAGFTEGGVYLGVDYTNTTTTGRRSVRLTSKKAYTKGLFIADIAHMPAGATGSGSCGLWPAFWMFGPNWPNSGEVDVIEGVNSQTSNSVSLHTGAGCTISNTGTISTTKLLAANCQGNEGCTQQTTSSDNYGTGFNAAGGGVYAVEWTSAAIKVWFFPRGSSAATQLAAGATSSSSSSSTASSPDPSTFGPPLAAFVGGPTCSIDQHFANHNLVFDTTFCGDWAGRVWADDETCSALASTCEDFVGQNPGAFTQAYWLVNGLRVYQAGGQAQGQQGRQQLRKVGFRRGGPAEGRRWRA